MESAFKEIKLWNRDIPLQQVIKQQRTLHLGSARYKRFRKALTFLRKDDKILHVFLVDKGHPEGKELHCVTKSGLIFILNEQKYLNNMNCFITVLLARQGQVKRLFEACGKTVPEETLNQCTYYYMNHLNV